MIQKLLVQMLISVHHNLHANYLHENGAFPLEKPNFVSLQDICILLRWHEKKTTWKTYFIVVTRTLKK